MYFSEDVNIQSIIEVSVCQSVELPLCSSVTESNISSVYVFLPQQQISFKGRKLKLGPAIMKERSYRMYSDALHKNFFACLVGKYKIVPLSIIFIPPPKSRVHAIPSGVPSSLDEPHSVLLLHLLLTHGRGYGTTYVHLQWKRLLQSGNMHTGKLLGMSCQAK